MSDRNHLRVGITCYPSVGGSGILAAMLGQALAGLGHEVHFIAYERPFRIPKDEPRLFFHAVEVNDYELFKYPDYTLPLSVKMAEVSAAHRLDILHVHYAVPHATAAILARDMLPENARPKIVATLHGTDTTLLGIDPGYGPAIRHALVNADAVTTVSEFLRSETQRLLRVDRPIEVIHNFFDPRPMQRSRREVRSELGVGEESLVVHASNLRALKRIDLLLQGFARIDRSTTAKLLILAGGDFSPYAALAKNLELGDRLILRSNVLEIEDYLSAADLALSTSDSESFGLSLLEAMAMGCPVVSTRVGGVPEVIHHGVDGWLVPAGNVEAIGQALQQLLDQPELRKTLAKAAKEKAATFSAKVIVPKYLELYRRLCDA